jgi:hypothetical protein
MKRFLLSSMILTMTLIVSGQPLTGTKTIPGSYATIQAAIAALNLQGVGSGGVIFNVAAGHLETFTSPTAGLITATGNVDDQIVFRKSGTGANPLITAGVGTSTSTDGIIKLAGTDYITFDGISLRENPLNNTNTKRMEWGYALVKKQNTEPCDGCQFVIIENCKVSLTEYSSSKGIYTANHTATSTTNFPISVSADAHNNCKFFSDTLAGCMEPISLNGSNSSYTLYDQNNEIGVDGGNVIAGIGGSRGIFAMYQNNLKIANNTITEPGTSISELSGIYTSTAIAAKISIYGNTISVINSSAGGSTLYGIKCYSGGGAGSVIKIFDNQVTDCGFSGGTSLAFTGIDIGTAPDSVYIYSNSILNNIIPGAGNLYGINISAETGPANLVIYANTISGNRKTGASGILYCMRTTNSNISAYLNEIYNNTFPASSGTILAQILGYYNGSAPPSENIYMNNIYDLTLGGTNTNSSTGIYGIYTYSYGAKNIYSNNVHGFSSHKGVVTGIDNRHGSTVNIFKNNIYDLFSGAGESNQTSVIGIFNNETTDAYIYNNYISDLKTASVSFSNAISGIYQGYSYTMWQKLYLFYNTIYLDATSTGSIFGTSAFYCGNTLESYYFSLVMNNNIFVNVSTPNGGGLTVAHRRYGTLILGYSESSDNNDFYAGVPDPNHLLFFDGTYGFETMAECKNWVSPRERKSFSENPPFINTATRPYDLHLNSPDPNLFESGGIVISAPVSITGDFDSNPRYPNPGYPDDPAHPAKAPDVGANEFAGIHLDLVPPVIEFTALEKTGSLLERNITATITDDFSGVPESGIGLPRLYWRIKHGTPGAWQDVQGISAGSDQYIFTFGAGVAEHDTVDYYIVAQDLAPVPNVSTSAGYGGAFTFNPPACVDIPDVYDSYFIMGTMCGSYNVGTGQTFETITDAMMALDNNTGTCPITFLLTDEEYLNEMYLPFAIHSFSWSDATRTITIKPAPGVTTYLTAYTGWAVFWLHGAAYVTIDGSNTENGTDRSMTIENLYGASGASAVRLSNDGSNNVQHCTIKNCMIKGGSRTNTNYGIYASDGGNQDISIRNNEILNATTGLYLEGNPSNVPNNGLIFQNTFGNQVDDLTLGYAAIETNHSDGLIISENTIQNIKNDQDNAYGMIIGQNTINASVTRNRITGIRYTGNGGYGGKGIDIRTWSTGSSILIANNVISDISGDGYDYLAGDAIVGIRIMGATDGVGLYYNSVNLSGEVMGSYSNDLSAAIFIDNNVSDITMKNNIFRNSITDTANNATAYAIVSYATNAAFTDIDFNDYFAAGSQGILGYFDNDIFNLADWQAATGQDNSSLGEDPLYIAPTDLNVQTGSPVLGAGTPVTGIYEDYPGNPRSDTYPSIGAYENAPEPMKTWNGSVSANWDDEANWTPAGVPLSSEDLLIPGSTPNPCTVNSTGMVCNHLTIAEGSSLEIFPANSLTAFGDLIIRDGGTLTNDGLLILKGNLVNQNMAK